MIPLACRPSRPAGAARSPPAPCEPREHELTIQLRAFDADKNGTGLGVPVLVAMTGALLERNTKGGLIIAGPLNLGGSTELLPNAVALAEAAIDKRATTLLLPISARKPLFELPDDLATKINIEFYADAPDAVFKSMVE
jgi:ATP-dependent Lon protease